MRVFVTGATGLIGRRLVRAVMGRGDEVVALTRRSASAPMWGESVRWVGGDPVEPGDWLDELATCDAVVHLAGEPVLGRRWSPAFKEAIRESRVRSTDLIARRLARDGSPRTLVLGSAIGLYGDRGEEELDESSEPSDDFFGECCRAWEAAAEPAREAGARLAVVRTGVVLDPEGGALAKLLTPFKLFAGGPLGSGRQWMSWVHRDDLRDLFLWCLDTPTASGAYNGVAAAPARNRDFARELGRALGRPSWLPAPRFALRLLIGEGARVVTDSARVFPRRALAGGFRHRFPALPAALADLLAVNPASAP